MKKIIAAFDGLRFSESTLQYTGYLAQQTNAHLVGVFLSESTRLSYAVYETIASQSLATSEMFSALKKADEDAIKKSMDAFELFCQNAKINYTMHRDKKNSVNELIHETLFADLLVIDAWETFSYIEGNIPGWFIKNILHDTQCPVIVVPKNFSPVERIVYLYDGSPSSVYAIKMFNYILPEFAKLNVELLFARKDSSSSHLPDDRLLKEWLKRHSSKIDYHVMEGNEKDIAAVLTPEETNCLVIAGAYHRSSFSMFFHESMANLLIRDTKVPVFIAHAGV